MNALELERREMHRTLRATRRTPRRRHVVDAPHLPPRGSLLKGPAGGGRGGLLPAHQHARHGVRARRGQSFRFAWVSDTHLYPKELNARFVEKTVRAFKEVQAMNPPADFLIFGGDLAQLGDPVELQPRRRAAEGGEDQEGLHPRRARLVPRHGRAVEQDLRRDALDLRPQGRAHHRARHDRATRPTSGRRARYSPKERMGHMATLDGTLGGAWSAVGEKQLRCLNTTLANWPKDQPVVIFTHTPLYEYYPPWNFWVRDWRAVHEILQALQQRHQRARPHAPGALQRDRQACARSACWPPRGRGRTRPRACRSLTKPMIRADPGDHFDGVGWAQLTVSAAGSVENEYKMWRKTRVRRSGCRLRHRRQPQPDPQPAHCRPADEEETIMTTTTAGISRSSRRAWPRCCSSAMTRRRCGPQGAAHRRPAAGLRGSLHGAGEARRRAVPRRPGGREEGGHASCRTPAWPARCATRTPRTRIRTSSRSSRSR